MKKMFSKRLGVGLIAVSMLTLAGCSTIKNAFTNRSEKSFQIERNWVRQTTQLEYVGPRVNHVMAPVIFDNMIIQGNEIDGIVAYDRKSGHKIWTKYIKGGVCADAKVDNNLLYFGAGDGFFYSVDPHTGNTKWSYPIKAEGIGAPTIDNGVVYFVAGNNVSYALSSNRGELIWTYGRNESLPLTIRGASEPSTDEKHVYIGFSDGYLVSLSKDKGTVVWEKQLNSNLRFKDIDSKPVIEGDRIYVSSYDGQLYCLKKINGSTIWVNENGGFSPVTIHGNNLYYATSDRKLMAIEKSSGKVLWKKDLVNTVASQPVIYKDLVLYGEWSGPLRVVSLKDGENITSFTTGWGVTSSATIDEKTGDVFLMSADANIYALKLVAKSRADVILGDKL